MKNIQVSSHDLLGARFNGYSLHQYLLSRGIESKQFVWEKKSTLPTVEQLGDFFLQRDSLKYLTSIFEREMGTQSFSAPFSGELFLKNEFLNADVVHYQLVHTGFFNFFHFPFLTRLKPSVWTIHDPWAFTGHCVHPFECDRWKIGCGNCPNLKTELPLKFDNTALNWEMKKFVFDHSFFDLVVASEWMKKFVEKSPLFSRFPVHVIPFGLDLQKFKPQDSVRAKERFGIPKENLVFLFRGMKWQLKGVDFLKNIFQQLPSDTKISLLVLNEKGCVDDLKQKYHVVEPGFISDESVLIDAYNAADVFLMPSTAESFGMMAVEAMACGKPVIAFSGTAVEETLRGGGVCVPFQDENAFFQAVQLLVSSPEKRKAIGDKARSVAEEYYSHELYTDRIVSVYKEAIQKHALSERDLFILHQLQSQQESGKIAKTTEDDVDMKNFVFEFIARWYNNKIIKFFCRKILFPVVRFFSRGKKR